MFQGSNENSVDTKSGIHWWKTTKATLMIKIITFYDTIKKHFSKNNNYFTKNESRAENVMRAKNDKNTKIKKEKRAAEEKTSCF